MTFVLPLLPIFQVPTARGLGLTLRKPISFTVVVLVRGQTRSPAEAEGKAGKSQWGPLAAVVLEATISSSQCG
jgi:hypothetical protein